MVETRLSLRLSASIAFAFLLGLSQAASAAMACSQVHLQLWPTEQKISDLLEKAVSENQISPQQLKTVLQSLEQQGYNGVYWDLFRKGPKAAYSDYLAVRQALPGRMAALIQSLKAAGLLKSVKTENEIIENFFKNTNQKELAWSLSWQMATFSLSTFVLKIPLGLHNFVPVDLPQLRLKNPKHEYVLNLTSKFYDRVTMALLFWYLWDRVLCEKLVSACMVDSVSEAGRSMNENFVVNLQIQQLHYESLLKTTEDPQQKELLSEAIATVKTQIIEAKKLENTY